MPNPRPKTTLQQAVPEPGEQEAEALPSSRRPEVEERTSQLAEVKA